MILAFQLHLYSSILKRSKMKQIFIVLCAFILLNFTACKSNENKSPDQPAADTIVNLNPTQVQQDSAKLSDDSATVKTAVGVKMEEDSAIQQQKNDAKKLEEDKKKEK